MNAPLRIGLVTPAWPGSNTANGIATAVANLARGLEANGHKVTIIPFEIDGPNEFPRVIQLPKPIWTLYERLQLRFGFQTESIVNRRLAQRITAAAWQAIAQHSIELLVMEETQGWVGVVSNAVSIPVVATLHGPWWLHRSFQDPAGSTTDRNRERREAEGLRQVAAITAPSHDVLERTRREWGLPEVPLEIIRNPAPMKVGIVPFDAGKLQRILFVGRFDLVKGGDLMIEAFVRLAQMHPTCRLTFAGPDVGFSDSKGRNITLARTLSALPIEIRARIDVLGPQSREQITQLRGTHGIAVVASRYENFGGAMVEAMAAGSALVCTCVGGGAEILTDGDTALLVPPEDPQAISDACLRLLNTPEFAQNLGESAYAYVQNNLSPMHIGRQMANFLRPLCRNG